MGWTLQFTYSSVTEVWINYSLKLDYLHILINKRVLGRYVVYSITQTWKHYAMVVQIFLPPSNDFCTITLSPVAFQIGSTQDFSYIYVKIYLRLTLKHHCWWPNSSVPFHAVKLAVVENTLLEFTFEARLNLVTGSVSVRNVLSHQTITWMYPCVLQGCLLHIAILDNLHNLLI